MAAFSEFTNEALGDEICTWAGRVAAGEAHLLALVGEFDRREAWGGPGLLSCAHWLSWRTGMGAVAARERVRVAKALRQLPDVEAAFGAGQMSWTQVRAITRVASPDDGVDWVDLARHASGAQIEKVCRGVRRVQSIAEAEADPELAEHRMRTTKRYDQDGNLVITIRASAEDGAVILAGLDAMKADIDRRGAAETDTETKPDDSAESSGASAEGSFAAVRDEAKPASDTDALLEMARRALASQRTEQPDIARRTRSRLVAQVDPLSGWGRLNDGELLPPSSLKTALKALPGRGGVLRLRPLTAHDLSKHDLGRSARQADQPLRELLGAIDGERCRFPGCTRKRKLHAHHIFYWSDGGPTDLANLVLVCGRHHTLIHAQGFRLVLHPDRRLIVTTADGVAVLHHPGLPWGDPAELDAARRITADTLPPTHCDARIDLGYVVSVLVQQAA